MEALIQNGNFWAILGAAIAFVVAGIGSSKGVGIAGQAGAGVLSEDPDKFVPVMVLEALPSTQAIYGFVIAFLILGKIPAGEPLSFTSGMLLLLAGMPVGFVGLVSAIFQGKVAAAGINMVAKQSGGMVKGVILALMVEMFAILSLIVSMLMIGKV
jgi:V/A-type H+-transporting ATPase subunit K